jgi:hypothetical protein
VGTFQLLMLYWMEIVILALDADALSRCFCSLQMLSRSASTHLKQKQPPASSGRLQRAQMPRGLSSAAEGTAAETPDARGAQP